MLVGKGLVSAGRPGATLEDQSHSGQSGAALRALLTEPPQEVCDVRSLEDLGQILEAEAYANVGASTSLPDLAVGAAVNVWAPTSPPVLDVVAAANVGATTSLAIGQMTTHR